MTSKGSMARASRTSDTLLPGGRLLPPDLIIQDELHLISGPLGTMVGLYETALDELCSHELGGQEHPAQDRRLDRHGATRREPDPRALQPPDGGHLPAARSRPPRFVLRRDPSTRQSNARLYLGVAAQGRSPKVAMLRVYLALLAAARKWYTKLGGKKGDPSNPADPYMTLLGYFNSLRELGGARRLIEDEVRNRLAGYATRERVGETEGLFENRQIDYEPVELTSRVSTAQVSEAKRRLSLPYSDKDRVDVAIATNMISVGLDITRLGLMVVFGQPKTSAEYIQATSRVGREHERPGLVVTILNIHKPRDRSHYERFAAYHESFYRSVEATSVTPFSPRALDRGLAGTLVALVRQGHAPMTPPRGAEEILKERARLDFAVECLARRARDHTTLPPEEAERLRQRTRDRARDLLDDWSKVAHDLSQTGVGLQYQTEVGAAQRLALRLPQPRAEEPAGPQPQDEVPRQPLAARRRAERQPLGQDDRRRGHRGG